MAEVFLVAIVLPIGALRDISFVIRSFKFDLAFLKIFYLEYVFVVGQV
jgi:hypothetical protein